MILVVENVEKLYSCSIYFVDDWLVDGSSAFWLMVTFVKRFARLLRLDSVRAIFLGWASSVSVSESECFLLPTKGGGLVGSLSFISLYGTGTMVSFMQIYKLINLLAVGKMVVSYHFYSQRVFLNLKY